LALSRVRIRVLQGGHDVPAALVRRRFGRSISNFFRHYRDLADSWILFDNSGGRPEMIAFVKDENLRIIQERPFKNLISRYLR
jgi:predicted ABC-type ATPase